MFKQPICFDIWGGDSGKYRLIDHDGIAVDKTPEDTCNRVAKALSDIEKNNEEWYLKFKNII